MNNFSKCASLKDINIFCLICVANFVGRVDIGNLSKLERIDYFIKDLSSIFAFLFTQVCFSAKERQIPLNSKLYIQFFLDAVHKLN